MDKNNREIEIKIKVADPEALKAKILELGGKKIKEGLQHDTMYDDGKGFFDGEKDRLPPRVLRLRRNPDNNKLTYKELLDEKEHEHMLKRLEIETGVEDYEAMDQIIRKLGFFLYRIKERQFEHYALDGFVVELHKLPFTGDFMEIEADEDELEKILPKLGFSIQDGINKDYTQIFYDYCADNAISPDTPQTFEEEKKHHLQKQGI